MSTRPVARRRWRAIGTTCEVLAESETLADHAATIARRQVAELDFACSRFRADSELGRLPHGRWVDVSPVLSDAIGAALRTAQRTDGLVDPTVATALRTLGYDADYSLVRHRRHAPAEATPAPGFWRIGHDPAARRVQIPRGVELDLGASAKAWAADRTAATLARSLPGAFLVNYGGDLAVAGDDRDDGWAVTVDDDDPHGGHQVIDVRTGGVATSSTTRRTWTAGGREQHHIVDPTTGRSAATVWATVTVTAASCELANAATTAAVILGTDGAQWLARRGLHARLVSRDGVVVYVGDWPAEPSFPRQSPALSA